MRARPLLLGLDDHERCKQITGQCNPERGIRMPRLTSFRKGTLSLLIGVMVISGERKLALIGDDMRCGCGSRTGAAAWALQSASRSDDDEDAESSAMFSNSFLLSVEFDRLFICCSL